MPDYSSVIDSGEREEMPTGSVRDSRAGKGRYDLIPPEGMRRLARHYENGAAKYGDDNWRKGQPFKRTLDSMARHLYRYLDGSRDEDHLAAVAWGAFALMHFEREIAEGRLPSSLDDLGAVALNGPREGESLSYCCEDGGADHGPTWHARLTIREYDALEASGAPIRCAKCRGAA